MTIDREDSPADAVTGSWVDHGAPSWMRPYLRLARADRPIGAWLLLWPCFWALTLARPEWRQWGLYILFFIGAFVMRGAGCVFNDIVDRDFDRRVERTRNRPLASGAVNLVQALAFMGLLLFVGLLVLLMLNPFSVWLGAGSLVIVAIYPFMKRFTDWPQLVLGFAFNWGALLGWAAVTGSLSAPAVALYLGGILWTLGYDTIYAHQDKDDDALIGVRSTARRFGGRTKLWLVGFYSGMLALLALAGYLANLHWVFYVVGALVAVQLYAQIIRVDIDDPDICLKVFRSNHLTGALVFLAIALAHIAAWVSPYLQTTATAQ
ncbi:4-hydroxybenzoate octaprenyltransferase [Govanella unica]|uniref:4-hydroxybenzoate octaprenyltransferase n=1 Tax=Govanella unica TaxID=2975056 RepID=A0A9X3TX98_9PROT|nr:4-hydroxybenzoate octaprenyltransferase [Govania unica]MDA5193343.1 4-hydroxybenzoate octaprenyltransferase [Govania unica]